MKANNPFLLRLRGIIFVALIVVSMAIYWPIPVLSGLFLSEKKAYYITTAWGRFIIWLLKHFVGISVNVVGAENIPKKPCVVLAKHQSALDIFVLLTLFDPQTWVMKKELLYIPCFGWSLMATKPIAIDRSAGRQALARMIAIGTKKLQNGFWVLLYPEGTRTLPGTKGTYKSGGVLLAQKAGVDVVPVALNTGLFWQKHKGLINTGTVDIVIGKPIQTAERNTQDLTEEVAAVIEKNCQTITENHPYYLAMKS